MLTSGSWHRATLPAGRSRWFGAVFPRCAGAAPPAAMSFLLFAGEERVELPLVGVVVEAVVELVARLHGLEHALLAALAADPLEDAQRGRVHRAKRRERV